MKIGEFVLLLGKDESYLIKVGNNINTKSGVIDSKSILKQKFGKKIKTHLGKEFFIVKPTILDLLEKKFKRGAQVVLPKDISLILSYTGINTDALIVDVGSGSGFLSIFLGNYVTKGRVVTYERDERFFKISKENIEISGLKNIALKKKDVIKGISEKNVDLVTLDLQFPEKVIKRAYNSLKVGGWLVVYSPTIEEVIKVSKEIKKLYFGNLKVIENIVREWQVEKTTRPKTMGLMHTGWLILTRKIR